MGRTHYAFCTFRLGNMKKILHIVLSLLLLFSCSRNMMEVDVDKGEQLPDGLPITITIPFNSTEMLDVDVTTKVSASAQDETRVHDLYVMIFSNVNLTPEGSPRKIYGQFFSYDYQKMSTKQELNDNSNECWFVENKGMGSEAKTKGAVKISTETCSDAILVVLANVSNSISNLDGEDALDRLAAVRDLNELRSIEVRLEQDVVNRKDLFLMTGKLGEAKDPEVPDTRPSTSIFRTQDLRWNKSNEGEDKLNYYERFQVDLRPLDAKVKFRIKVNTDNIDEVTPVYWQVLNVPDRCYLDSDWNDEEAPEQTRYFKSQQYYFEGTEEEDDDTYYTFTFYMLENRLNHDENGNPCGVQDAVKYYEREKQNKIPTGEYGYGIDHSGEYVRNDDWLFAPAKSTYVKFDLILRLTETGLASYADIDEDIHITQALTSDAIFTVHLGNFGSSDDDSETGRFNNYWTQRGNSYIYTITVNNTSHIYAEVKEQAKPGDGGDWEAQSGLEGFLLLTNTEIINADCHYEYHQITFHYNPDMTQDRFSWYVKTPFSEGGPDIIPLYKKNNEEEWVADTNDFGDQKYEYEADGGTYSIQGQNKTGKKLDYRWVMFGLNPSDGVYTKNRHAYPGISHYDRDWAPGKKVRETDDEGEAILCNDMDRDIPDLMDITQLIKFIFFETQKKKHGIVDNLFDTEDNICLTAFIDEYYYEKDPLDDPKTAKVDPNLWRKFVNATPREMHILSDAQSSRDRKSDVILSSHSVIQQSIQTIYNIHAPDLNNLWGTEHKDEMRYLTGQDAYLDDNPGKSPGWPYWPGDKERGTESSGRAGYYDNGPNEEANRVGKWNGRLNSAHIWDIYDRSNNLPKTNKNWSTFLNYEVENNTPELKEAYEGMAYSCLTRNRDNNGDNIIDCNEVRWYLAACNQLAGMWIGNEALSLAARLYRPEEGQWRSHIISSSGKRVLWAEEGGGATQYGWDFDYKNRYVWHTIEEAAEGESVRCLRNIGTFDNGTKDVTEADYDQEIDSYFKLTPNGDGSYTFDFNHINPKSLRTFSSGELPYHEQFSENNCVYLKMHTQAPSQNVGDGVKWDGSSWVADEEDSFKKLNPIRKNQDPKLEDINNDVTTLGYNPYCPPGYRFPNQSEMLLMSLYLPSSYFNTSKSGASYGSVYLPTRTYYNRGKYGSVTTNMPEQDLIREKTGGVDEFGKSFKGKVGWCYTTSASKQSCIAAGNSITRSRCVRDDVEMIGHIEGGIILEKEEAYPGDTFPISLSFFSSGSAFVAASLKLRYSDGMGVFHETDIPLDETPNGLEYNVGQKVIIPSLSALGFGGTGWEGHDMSLKITIRNTTTTKEVEVPFSLQNPLLGRMSVEEDIFPKDENDIIFNFATRSNTSELSSVYVDLHYTDIYGNARVQQVLSRSNLSIKNLAGTKLAIPELDYWPDLDAPISFEARMTDDGGCTKTQVFDFDDAVCLRSHILGGVEFPNEFNEDDGVPVRLGIYSANPDVATISAASLWWKAPDAGGFTEITFDAPALEHLNAKEWTDIDQWIADLINDGPSAAKNKEFQFYCTAICNDDKTSVTTPVRSMTLIRFNECDNPGPWEQGRHRASDIKNKWAVTSITNLDYSRGDYLEADIDVTNCRYLRYNGNNNDDIGMDNLISIGISNGLDWKPDDIYFYYPAYSPTEAPGENRLQVSIFHHNNKVSRLRPYDLPGSLNIKLSKDLLLVNGAELDYSDDKSALDGKGDGAKENSEAYSRATISTITASSTTKVGSVEGRHRSRATYRYVRVIRERTDVTP